MIDLIKKFWLEHHTLRKTVSHAVQAGFISFATIIIAAEGQLLLSMPEYAMIIVILMTGMKALLNWAKHNVKI